MQIIVSTISGDVVTLDVAPDIELENFKALVEFEIGIPAQDMVLMHNMKPLLDEKNTLQSLGITDGSMLLAQHLQRQQRDAIDASGSQEPTSRAARPDNDPARIRDQILSNPEQLALLKHNQPQLAEALLSGDLGKFADALANVRQKKAEADMMKMKMATADPFDKNAQRLIEDYIKQQNINSNMEAAMEYHPESFGTVAMLYINCKVNGHHVKAFVDSGAQSTIMSAACAERCGIMRLVDTRWEGIAKGVGTQKIIGRVHLVQLEIEQNFLTSSFTVLQTDPMDMLLGLDMLKRHQCVIDLKRNCLLIGTTNTETPFLPESEIPRGERGGEVPMDEDKALQQAIENSRKDAAGPSGSSSSAFSGAGHVLGGNSTTTTSRHSQAVINELVSLGFKRDDVLVELDKSDGDKNKAISALFSKSLVVPK